MLDSSLVYIISRTFPESLIVILLGMILLDKKGDKWLVFKNGMIFGFLVTAIRMLPISFGVHTILAMIVFGIIMYRFSKENMVKTVITTCVVWIALALSESIYVLIVTGVLGVPLEKLMDKSSISGALITLPSLILTILIVLIFNIIKNKIEEKVIGN